LQDIASVQLILDHHDWTELVK